MWCTLKVQDVCKKLNTNIQKGLNDDEAIKRKKR